jgi:cell filamentation protein
MSDPYVYPGTSVLINKLDLQSQSELDRFERLMVAQRLSEPPPAVEIGYEGYKILHHHLFQDVYDWAGQPRTVDISKEGSYFCRAEFIDSEMENRFRLIREEHWLQHLSQADFAERTAEHLGEINAIHPFREGNGRTQQLFLEILAKQAGHMVLRERIAPEAWNRASINSFQGDYNALRDVIRDSMATCTPNREGS